MYVLLSEDNNYFVEYLLGHLATSTSITKAKVFDDFYIADRFKILIYYKYKIKMSINTFIK